MARSTMPDTSDFVQAEPAETGSGWDVTCYTQDGDPIPVSHNVTETMATTQAEAIATALCTWEGWL